MADTQTVPDWRHEARTLLAAGYGQRETARQLGVPEERLKKWAQRSGIAASVKRTLAKVPMSPNVPQVLAADVLQGEAERLGPDARHLAARIGHKALSDIVTKDGEELLAALPAANEAGSLLQKGNVPGWERQADSGTKVAISIFSAEQPRPIEARMIESPSESP